MGRSTSLWQTPAFHTAQQCNTLVHFPILEMYVFLHRSAMGKYLPLFMIQQLCGHQTWHRVVFVYVCWSPVLVQMDPLSWTGLHFEALPLECWTALPPSILSLVVQNVKESTLHRWFDSWNDYLMFTSETFLVIIRCEKFSNSRCCRLATL